MLKRPKIIILAAVIFVSASTARANPIDIVKSLTPICWFGSQCWDEPKDPDSKTIYVPKGPAFFATLRVFCSDDSFVDINIQSKISISDAERAAKKENEDYDVCSKLGHTYSRDTSMTQWMHRNPAVQAAITTYGLAGMIEAASVAAAAPPVGQTLLFSKYQLKDYPPYNPEYRLEAVRPPSLLNKLLQ